MNLILKSLTAAVLILLLSMVGQTLGSSVHCWRDQPIVRLDGCYLDGEFFEGCEWNPYSVNEDGRVIAPPGTDEGGGKLRDSLSLRPTPKCTSHHHHPPVCDRRPR